ncbi:XRE family transcriptional regulator [Telluribacter humicola]|uniref:XRE family transcriptional regulator n=1 Tax=Telluribacter humicola TaxID=1720261 RepID=UPI001A96536E|nr:helix-turn-helix transcriptional regulator [Telluribacter humicola]
MTDSNVVRAAKLKRYIDQYADGKQTVFAELVGIIPANLSMMLSGKRPISNRMWQRIHTKLGFTDETLPEDLRAATSGMLSPDLHEGDQLRKYLESHGIPQKELAEKLGVSTVSVNSYMKTKRFRADALKRILEALGVTEDIIMNKRQGGGNYVANFVPLVKVGQRRNPDWDKMGRVDLGNRPVPKNSILVEIGNDYMQPALLPGWQVIAAEVPEERWKYTTGLVVVHFAGEIVVRRIRKNELVTQGWLTLECDDQDGPTVSVVKEDIQKIWTIESIFYGPPK